MPIDVARATDLRINHKLSYPQIAAIEGVSPQAVHQRLRHLIPDETTKFYQDNQADIWDNVAIKCLTQLDARRLKKANARDAVWSAAVAVDKSRLIRGESTSNVEIHQISSKLGELEARRIELAERRKAIEANVTSKQGLEYSAQAVDITPDVKEGK